MNTESSACFSEFQDSAHL